MAKIEFKHLQQIEHIFGLPSGYVLDFSNNSFERFVKGSVNLDVYSGFGYTDYCSKANKLRQIISKESDFTVGKLINDLLEYCVDFLWEQNKFNQSDERIISELKTLAERLMQNGSEIELPCVQNEDLETLLEDIQNSLNRNKPSLIVDRLHTFAIKYIRQLCLEYKIEVCKSNGDYYPLHSLGGMLKSYYEKNCVFKSDFTSFAMHNNISLFEKYNHMRNNDSFAHDNEIVDDIEAEFAVKTMANVLTFIDKIEKSIDKTEPKSVGLVNNDLPF